MRIAIVFFLGQVAVAVALGGSQIHPSLERLGKSTTEQWDNFEAPYSFCQTTRRFEFPLKTLQERLYANFLLSRLDVSAHFSISTQPGIGLDNIAFPKELSTKKEIEGLKRCSTERCYQKLQNDFEKKSLIASTEKIEIYRKLVLARIERFLKSQTLYGYEDRKDNIPALRQMLTFFPYFKDYYPQTFSYFREAFWKKAPREKIVQESFLRARTWVLGEKILEPIFWISEVFRLHEAGTELYVEIPIYSNHYFDSWIRVYELLPIPKNETQSALVLTDIMEIDELKKSSLIRMLYKGKMNDAIFAAQKTEWSQLQSPPIVPTKTEVIQPSK